MDSSGNVGDHSLSRQLLAIRHMPVLRRGTGHSTAQEPPTLVGRADPISSCPKAEQRQPHVLSSVGGTADSETCLCARTHKRVQAAEPQILGQGTRRKGWCGPAQVPHKLRALHIKAKAHIGVYDGADYSYITPGVTTSPISDALYDPGQAELTALTLCPLDSSEEPPVCRRMPGIGMLHEAWCLERHLIGSSQKHRGAPATQDSDVFLDDE
ncbi:hypothetical protein E5288_WYG007596 [Bos mutus]|uniref:Uncharacterized protein n=1 Tax=Bos mutus TaxID=72004 RepID=A0A6B0RGG4_9CETA|nr:hypothetical protein [Bos mutus]